MAPPPASTTAGPERPAPPRCRVAIVDDHAAIIGMMARVVEAIAGYHVIGYAKSAPEARELCRRSQPDLIVLDLVLPNVVGFALHEELRRLCPRARVVIFSGHLRGAVMRDALLSGAHGLVEKSASLEEFDQALRSVGAGQVYFSRTASDAIRRMVHRDPAHPVPTARLTGREQAVLRALAEGLSTKEISARLGISPHTVVNHRTRLGQKTGLRGVAQLARYAVQLGLVPETIDPG